MWRSNQQASLMMMINCCVSENIIRHVLTGAIEKSLLHKSNVIIMQEEEEKEEEVGEGGDWVNQQ